jgi:mono/diheme cytochrome c family protein
MKQVLKWIGIVLAGLIGLIILAVVIVFVVSNSRVNATYDIEVESVEISTGEDVLEQGKHVAIVRGCTDCHTGNLAGGILIDDPAIGQINPTNLTSGQGGIGDTYTDEDWVRAIRHGVGPDSKPLIFMPSHEFYFLNDGDLGALIAYLKSLPPVDNQPPEITIGPLGRVLFLADQFDLVPAEKVDHDGPRPVAPEPGVTVEYGQYMAVGCTGCHGPGFSGGPIPGVPPDWPPASNITPGGDIANWTEAEFIDTMRNGFNPSGKQLNPEYMPWPTFGQMTDDELKAMWLYLQSLPAKDTGNR